MRCASTHRAYQPGHALAHAAAIRAIFDEKGALSAAIELRRRFPGVTDYTKALAGARTIAGWAPLPVSAATVTRLRRR